MGAGKVSTIRAAMRALYEELPEGATQEQVVRRHIVQEALEDGIRAMALLQELAGFWQKEDREGDSFHMRVVEHVISNVVRNCDLRPCKAR